MESKSSKNKRKLKGEVVSKKMAKTIVVKVIRMKMHPKYQKQYKISKKYKVHDEKQLANFGDKVIFEECRPLSKEKKWRLIKISSKGLVQAKSSSEEIK